MVNPGQRQTSPTGGRTGARAGGGGRYENAGSSNNGNSRAGGQMYRHGGNDKRPPPQYYGVNVMWWPRVPPPPPLYPWGQPRYMYMRGPRGCMPPQAPEEEEEEEGSDEEPPSKKMKRAATSKAVGKQWTRAAAEKALAAEAEFQKNAGSKAIVIRFPDPELSKEIVQDLIPCKSIDNIHFQTPCGPRYCFVTISKDAHVEKVMEEINDMKFGVGNLVAERKVEKTEENVGPENIDPCTLYVGNLPTNISTLEVKEKFPTAMRIDVGYAQKMKYTRYAFVKYSTAEAALEAYKESVNTVIASRSIILRFRRHKVPVGPPDDSGGPLSCVVENEKAGPRLGDIEKSVHTSSEPEKCSGRGTEVEKSLGLNEDGQSLADSKKIDLKAIKTENPSSENEKLAPKAQTSDAKLVDSRSKRDKLKDESLRETTKKIKTEVVDDSAGEGDSDSEVSVKFEDDDDDDPYEPYRTSGDDTNDEISSNSGDEELKCELLDD